MSNSEWDGNIESSIRNVLKMSPVVGITCSCVYLWFYWSGFGVRVFEHVDLGALLAYAVAPSLFALGVAVLLGLWLFMGWLTKGVFLLGGALLGAFMLLVGMWFYTVHVLWFLVPPLFTFTVGMYLDERSLLRKHFPHERIRNVFLFSALFLMSSAFSLAQIEVASIKAHTYYYQIWSPQLSAEDAEREGSDWIYLGRLRDTVFLQDKRCDAVVITNESRLVPYTVRRIDKPGLVTQSLRSPDLAILPTGCSRAWASTARQGHKAC